MKRLSWSVASLSVLLAASLAPGAINLTLEPAGIDVETGASLTVQLWARADTAQSFDGVEVLLNWDSTLLTLTGHDDSAGTYTWGSSGFPDGSQFNADLGDGDALYQGFAALGTDSPSTDLLVTTLQFTAGQQTGTTVLTIVQDSNTEIASGGQSVLGTVTGATVTVSAGSSGGGGTGGGDDGSTDDGTGDDTGSGDDGNVDDGSDDGADSGDDGSADDGNDDDTGSDDNDSSGDDGQQDDDDTSGVVAPPLACGAGVVQTLMMGLCLMMVGRSGPRRRRGTSQKVRAQN